MPPLENDIVAISIIFAYLVWYIVSHTLAKHGRDQFGVDVLSIQVLVLGVEEESGGIRPHQVSEGLSHHSEAEHTPILESNKDIDTDITTYISLRQNRA